MRLLPVLLLCATAPAGGIASHIHVVKVTSDRSTFVGGTSRQTLAAPALCVGPDGLMMAVGFSLDKPDRDELHRIKVTVITPDGDELDAEILRGDDTMRCTFFRIAKGQAIPAPVPLAGAPLKVGDTAVVLGRHGEVMEYARRRLDLIVEAAVAEPKVLYVLRGARSEMKGSIVATADGRLVGFLDSRPTFRDGGGLMLGVGSQTLVVVPSVEYMALSHKPSAKAWLGVNLAPFDRPREDYFNVEGDWSGALVTGVSPDSPAARAGIQIHDLLQSIGSLRMRYERPADWEEMLRTVQRLPLDQPLKCRVVRFAQEPSGRFVARPVDLTIVLAERPTDFEDAVETEVGDLDLRVKPVTDDWRRLNRLPAGLSGAVVTKTKRASPAQLAGLRSGDLILAVDGKPVRDPAALSALVAEAKAARRPKVLLLVRKPGGTTFLAVEPGW